MYSIYDVTLKSLVRAPGHTFNTLNRHWSCSLSAWADKRFTLQRYCQNYSLSTQGFFSCPTNIIVAFLREPGAFYLADKDSMLVTLHCPFELPLTGMLFNKRISLVPCCMRGFSPFVMGIEPNWKSILVIKQ